MRTFCEVARGFLDSLCNCTKGRLVFVLGPVRSAPNVVTKSPQYKRFPILGEITMAVQITIDQKVPCSIKPVDRKGNPAQVDGTPVWATDNTDLIQLVPSADGLSCDIVALGVLGTANVQVTADADLGDGVKPLIGTLAVEVTPGDAVVMTIEAGTPTNQE